MNDERSSTPCSAPPLPEAVPTWLAGAGRQRLDAVDAHIRHLFEYGQTKKAEKPLEAMEGLLSRETLGEGDATKGPA